MKKIIEKINLKYLHIIIILLGILFISLTIFHTNMWFDESYSVGIARHSFSEIWKITGNDVHPPLYYFCLHLLYLVFGNNMIAYRVLSMLSIAVMGILGYTHIRKDFGEKTGFIFSFLTLFLPVSAFYAGEIRMYSLGMLLGSIMAIYAYRIYKAKINKFTYILFGLSSLALAYTHYYGLMLAGIINFILFVYLIKNAKNRKQDLIKFIITALIQVIGYLPWLITFLRQLKGISGGFWITLSFPETFYDILTIQYQGNLKIQPIVLSALFYAYIIYLTSKVEKQEKKPAKIATYIYVSIIVIPLLASLCMQSVILLNRYLLIGTGLLIFAIAFFMSKDEKKWRTTTVCIIILILSCISNIITIKENYAVNNRDWIQYMRQNIQQNDIIVYSNAINGAVFATDLSNDINVKSYFYNNEHWGVQEAYKAFSPYMEIKDTIEEILDSYNGRIWLVESGYNNALREEISKKYNINNITEKVFEVPYRNYSYTIELIEK